jgi:two-component system NtrC family response regulator
LFLDEVGEMPASLQVKLLRVLQEMEFERVGGTRSIKVDVRVLSASNRILKEEVAEGLFREDLYYRLDVITIEVPPLRERSEDIKLLVQHFIEKYRRDDGKSEIEISPEVWKALFQYQWPGNVRELENVIERAVVLKSDNFIRIEDLPIEVSGTQQELEVEGFIPMNAPLQQTLEAIEEKLIRRALKSCDNIQSRAAEMLGITKSLMQHKIRKYNIIL